MLVKFKLSADQLVRALGEVATIATFDEDFDDPNTGWGGSLIGTLYWHQNKVQFMTLSEETGEILYEGDRHPLVQDGGLETLRKIAGDGGLEALRVIEYKTTMPEMSWYETREDLALRQVAACRDLAEAARIIGIKPGDRYWYGWQLGAAYAALERFPGAAYAAPGTPQYRRLVASGEVENARLRSQLQAMWD